MAYTQEWFLEKAHEVHGDKYDYSKVNYVNQTEKVCIICLKHGEFWQSPYLHLRGNGCAKIQERDKRKYQKCLEEGIQIYYLTYERLPDDFEYFAPVYNDFQIMIDDVKKKKCLLR